jgi:hypothetical protein
MVQSQNLAPTRSQRTKEVQPVFAGLRGVNTTSKPRIAISTSRYCLIRTVLTLFRNLPPVVSTVPVLPPKNRGAVRYQWNKTSVQSVQRPCTVLCCTLRTLVQSGTFEETRGVDQFHLPTVHGDARPQVSQAGTKHSDPLAEASQFSTSWT